MMDAERKRTEEAEANYFAMCLLIPEKFIKKDLLEIGGIDLTDDTAISKLATRYQVSVSLMIVRCTEIMDRDSEFREELRRKHR